MCTRHTYLLRRGGAALLAPGEHLENSNRFTLVFSTIAESVFKYVFCLVKTVLFSGRNTARILYAYFPLKPRCFSFPNKRVNDPRKLLLPVA